MATPAIAIRDAIFSRVSQVYAWKTARKTDVPTLSGGDVPALSIFLLSDTASADGDANSGAPKFLTDATVGISVMLGFDDPLVLDGNEDSFVDAIKQKLLTDGSFNGYPPAGAGLFEGITRVARRRQWAKGEAEAYFIELILEMTFQYRERFLPVMPNWLEQIDVTAFPGTVTAEGVVAEFQVGKICYTVTGPANGSHLLPSGAFTVSLEPGATFSGDQSITINDGDVGGEVVPSVGSSGAAPLEVTPLNGATSFTFTYQPPSAGNLSLSFASGQGWADPSPLTYVAT